jgi:hypothetical protein
MAVLCRALAIQELVRQAMQTSPVSAGYSVIVQEAHPALTDGNGVAYEDWPMDKPPGLVS